MRIVATALAAAAALAAVSAGAGFTAAQFSEPEAATSATASASTTKLQRKQVRLLKQINGKLSAIDDDADEFHAKMERGFNLTLDVLGYSPFTDRNIRRLLSTICRNTGGSLSEC